MNIAITHKWEDFLSSSFESRWACYLLVTNNSAEMRLHDFIGRVIKGNGASFTWLTGIFMLMSSAAI